MQVTQPCNSRLSTVLTNTTVNNLVNNKHNSNYIIDIVNAAIESTVCANSNNDNLISDDCNSTNNISPDIDSASNIDNDISLSNGASSQQHAAHYGSFSDNGQQRQQHRICSKREYSLANNAAYDAVYARRRRSISTPAREYNATIDATTDAAIKQHDATIASNDANRLKNTSTVRDGATNRDQQWTVVIAYSISNDYDELHAYSSTVSSCIERSKQHIKCDTINSQEWSDNGTITCIGRITHESSERVG